MRRSVGGTFYARDPAMWVVAVVGLFATGLIVYNHFVLQRSVQHEVPELDDVMRAHVDINRGHSQLEEFLAGDKDIRPADVWNLLDRARRELDSARRGEGVIVGLRGQPPEDPALVARLRSLIKSLDRFRDLARKRMESPESGLQNTPLDNDFDNASNQLQIDARLLADRIEELISAARKSQEQSFDAVLIVWVLVFVIACGALGRLSARRRLAEMARDRFNDELRDKNQELESVVYVASHDLRSPLVNIQGFGKELDHSCEELRAAISEIKSPLEPGGKLARILHDDIPQALTYINKSAAKMDALLAGLLKLSRVGRAALVIEPLDMNQMLAGIAETMEFRIKGGGVTVQIEPIPACRGDATQINQVFSNLMDNALKYLDPERPGRITVRAAKHGDGVAYCVEDNGLGIAPEHREQVFKVFHRLNPTQSDGEGLGLTIAERIVTRHGGRIWVESDLGKGSRFYVLLPSDE